MPKSRIEFLTEDDIRTSGYIDSLTNEKPRDPEPELDTEYENKASVFTMKTNIGRKHGSLLQNQKYNRNTRHKSTRTSRIPTSNLQKTSPTLKKYVKSTNLTDDFRHLVSPGDDTSKLPLVFDYCPVCLEGPNEPRILPCHHAYCRACLQFVIDKEGQQSDSDRGFLCKMCKYFVKVPNYSVPRSEWADQLLLDEYKFLKNVTQARIHAAGIEDFNAEAQQNDIELPTQTDRWLIEWLISAFPKSYILEHNLDPTRRTLHRFQKRARDASNVDDDDQNESATDSDDKDGNRDDQHRYHTESISSVDGKYNNQGQYIKDNRHKLKKVSKEIEAQGEDTARQISRITAATFYNDRLILYDEEFCEITIYNNDLTVQSCLRQHNVHSLAVLDNLLFMTIPDDRSVEIIDLDNLQSRPSIKLTLICYGVAALVDRIAVLLCENEDIRVFHLSFLDENGIIGGRIPLQGGHLVLEAPRHVAVCPLTRLLYVSDAKKGYVKCYRMDGRLCWEKIVIDAGALATFNGDIIVARRFTNSLDVLTGGGVFNGRLESEEYSILMPSVIAVDNNDSNIVVVDGQQFIHVFKLKKNPNPAEVVKEACTCAIL